MPDDRTAGAPVGVDPDGKPMEIAAATPNIPWTDLAYSLQPNGSTLDYVAESPYLGPNGDRMMQVILIDRNEVLRRMLPLPLLIASDRSSHMTTA